MDINNNLHVQNPTIEMLYKYYKSEILLVNRRYQRKLVWTVEEKEAFIDSISIDYPVPLLLVAEVNYKGKEVYEIIDGMQRLNAVMDFLEGEFPLHGKYFDMDSVASIKLQKDKGELKQKQPKLSSELSSKIAGYSLPFSVTTNTDPKVIDDIFKRINSGGKHLSPHEIRQAGATNHFGHIVRVLSESIRQDVSHSDILTLNSMKQISINSYKLHYGINLGNIFWCSHGIISKNNVRDSRDEEMVAHLLSAILKKPRPSATSSNLDKFYQTNGDFENLISLKGESSIIDSFEAVFEEIKKTFESTGSTFKNVLFKEDVDYVNRTFQVFFLAFYDMLVDEQKKIDNYVDLCKSLEGVGDSFFADKAERYNHSKEREQAIAMAKGLMSKYFSSRTNNDPALSNGVTRLRNLLSSSQTENTNYDFKIGLHSLEGSGDFNLKLLRKVVKTLSAMVNQGPESVGYVIIGVADDKDDAKRFESFYGKTPRLYKNFYITGVQEEALKYKTHDLYTKFVKDKINSITEVDATFRSLITRNMDYIRFYDKSILILRAYNEGSPVKFDNKFYERNGSHNQEITDEKLIWKRFV